MTPLASLSGGQWIRAAPAALVVASPDILLMDEPKNILDRDGRDRVIDLLRTWKGAAIVVSHVRELSDVSTPRCTLGNRRKAYLLLLTKGVASNQLVRGHCKVNRLCLNLRLASMFNKACFDATKAGLFL